MGRVWQAEAVMSAATPDLVDRLVFQLSALADADRLFGYCLRRAGDTDFFLRKAIGWALRQYAYVAPETVRAFVKTNEAKLSGLSKREALKNL
jgi:3-methyladenine DNA glycosylase AlkD